MLVTQIKNRYFEDSKNYVTVNILADEKPSTLPTTGQNIKGMSADEYIAPGSSIFTVDGDIVFMGESGWGDWI